LSAAVSAGVIGGSSETNPVRTHPHVANSVVHQIIVKLRGVDAATPGVAQTRALSGHDRIANLVARSGLTMHETHPIFDRLHVVQVEPTSAGDSIATTISQLEADPDVEYAVADERRYIHAVPDDPLYSTGGQWYEQADSATPAAVDAQGAWDFTTGDSNMVI